MKTILFFIIFIGLGLPTRAQVKPLKTSEVEKKALNKNVGKNIDSKPKTLVLNVDDYSTALNGGTLKADAGIEANERGKTLAEDLARQQNEYVYGTSKSKSYAIRYSSDRVKAVYDEFVPSLIANSTYALTNHNFVDLLVPKLSESAASHGIYTSPGARGTFEKAIREVFVKVNITNPAAYQPSSTYTKNTYYTPFLNEVFEATKSVLSQNTTWTTTTNYGGLSTDTGGLVSTAGSSNVLYSNYPTTNTTSSSEYSLAVAFLNGRAIDICVETAKIIGKKIFSNKSDQLLIDNFSKNLNAANQGILFQKIRSFKGQSSEYEVFVIQQGSFQNATKQNGLSSYWDKDCNCPSAYAYTFLGAYKVKNATVYNP